MKIKFKIEPDLIVFEDYADHYDTGDKIMYLHQDPTIYYTVRAKTLINIEGKWYYAHLLDRSLKDEESR